METNRIEISLEMLVTWPTWAIMVEADVGPEDAGVPAPIPAYETEPTKVEPFVRGADMPRMAVAS